MRLFIRPMGIGLRVWACLALAVAAWGQEGALEGQLLGLLTTPPTYEGLADLFQSRTETDNPVTRDAIVRVCAAGLIRLNRLDAYRLHIRPALADAAGFERPFVAVCEACAGAGKTDAACKACNGSGPCPAQNCRNGQVPDTGFSSRTGGTRGDARGTLGGGSAGSGGTRKCLRCGGSGKCPDCAGTGRTEPKCARCQGRGSVWDSSAAPGVFDQALQEALAAVSGSAPDRPTPAFAADTGTPNATASDLATTVKGRLAGLIQGEERRVWAVAGLILLTALGVSGLRVLRTRRN